MAKSGHGQSGALRQRAICVARPVMGTAATAGAKIRTLLTGATRGRLCVMAAHAEIERKFLLGQPPAGWQRGPSVSIEQGYFPLSVHEVEVRLRRRGSTCLITVKTGHGFRRREEEREIPPAIFRMLWPLTRSRRLAKRRYVISAAGRCIEVDVYRGRHRGLRTAEVEFPSGRASRAWQPPAWLGREITGERQYGNAELAHRGRAPRLTGGR